MSEAQNRRALVHYSKGMHRAGWVANHDGNLSVRVTSSRYVITPTSMSKADVELDDLVVVNGEGKKVAGKRRAFSEMALHLAVYRGRPKVGAVVHAHPPMAMAYGLSGKPLPHPSIPEAVVSLGAEIPTVPLSAPGSDAVAALAPFVRRCDAVLIAGNGVLSWGPTLELAYLRMELVEHIARIGHAAAVLGGAQLLPTDLVTALVAKRRKAGLNAPEEGLEMTNKSRGARVEEAAQAQISAAMPHVDPRRLEALTREITAALLK
jgi:L-fuculose-phosphate aldolase